MFDLDHVVNRVLHLLDEREDKKVKPLETDAEVKAVDGDTAYVTYAGSTLKTPVDKTINVKKGDKVRVRVVNGVGYIAGNVTHPPTDDTKADDVAVKEERTEKRVGVVEENVNAVAKATKKVMQYFWHKDGDDTEAGVHITEVPRKQFEVTPTGNNILIRSNSIKLRNALITLMELQPTEVDIWADGGVVARFGAHIRLGGTDEHKLDIYEDSIYFEDEDGARIGAIRASYDSDDKPVIYITAGFAHFFSVDEDCIKAHNAHSVITAQEHESVALNVQSEYYRLPLENSINISDGGFDIYHDPEDVDDGDGVKCNWNGHVLVSGQAQFSGVNDGDVCNVEIRKVHGNTTTVESHSASRSASNRTEIVVTPRLVEVSRGDVLYLYVANTSAGEGLVGTTSSSVTPTADDKHKNFMTVQYV